MAKVRVEVAAVAELMVSKSNRELFGETEFVLRDRCHTIGGHVLDADLSVVLRHVGQIIVRPPRIHMSRWG
jgi:hypothetical protein